MGQNPLDIELPCCISHESPCYPPHTHRNQTHTQHNTQTHRQTQTDTDRHRQTQRQTAPWLMQQPCLGRTHIPSFVLATAQTFCFGCCLPHLFGCSHISSFRNNETLPLFEGSSGSHMWGCTNRSPHSHGVQTERLLTFSIFLHPKWLSRLPRTTKARQLWRSKWLHKQSAYNRRSLSVWSCLAA